MTEFFEFFIKNPIVLIFVAGWLLHTLGNLGAKAARRAVEQQARQERQEQRQTRVELPSAQTPEPVAKAAPARPAGPSPDEIAAEIRKMMGLEREESVSRPVIEVEPEPELPSPRPVVRQMRFEQPPEPVFIEVDERRPRLPDPAGAAAFARPVTRPAMKRQRLLDISNPAKAFVAMEVLGPPRALRDLQ